MLFWWLTIGFAVVWVIAVVIEVVWFWGPDEEPEPSLACTVDEPQDNIAISPSSGEEEAEGAAEEKYQMRVTGAGG